MLLPLPCCWPRPLLLLLLPYRAPVQHWWQHVVVDVGRQLGHSCGDLIFSSHMTFILMGAQAGLGGGALGTELAQWQQHSVSL